MSTLTRERRPGRGFRAACHRPSLPPFRPCPLCATLSDCWQELLVDSCRYPGSGVAARAPCTDPNASFPVPFPGQCEGLAGPLAGVATADACAAACCADASCNVWQFCAAGGCSGSQAPPNSCYTGADTSGCGGGGGWQGAGSAVPPYHFHDAAGNPVVNKTRFPDMNAMTDAIHALGLTSGWYGNNCFCHENRANASLFKGDAAALVAFGFDAAKYDGCGQEHNMTLWAELFEATEKGPGMVLENCNNDNALIPRKGADLTKVPFHFYRTSTDIRPTYGSVMNNAQTVLHLSTGSGPSCWACACDATLVRRDACARRSRHPHPHCTLASSQTRTCSSWA